MIYFDYAATTPIDKEVMSVYIKTQENFFANTNSLHKLGQMSNYMFEKATNEIKDLLGIKRHNIIYTSNATEANNLSILGFVEAHSKGKLITTKIEHPSVHEVFKKLANDGYEVVYLDVNSNGIIDLEELKKELTKDVILVSIMWVNNIVGSIQPIGEVIEMLKEYPKVKLHVDVVQGIGKIKPDFSFNDIDFLTLSGHKIYCPKGIGMLAIRDNINLHQRIFGANNQYKIKPGTLDLALVVSLTKAMQLILARQAEDYKYVKELNLYFRDKIKDLKNIVINSSSDASPFIISFSILNIKGSTLLNYLEEKNIYISTGSACSSKYIKLEKTIFAMTKDEVRTNSSVRVSFSHLSTKEEINILVEVLKKLYEV